MTKPSKIKLMVVLFSLVLSFALAEFYARHKGRFDEDGNFYFMFKRLRPYKLPVKQVERAVEEYERENNSYIMYDPDLGWSIRPNSVSRNGLHKSNSLGIRSAPSEIDVNRAPGVLRIALFGDSYTHCDDVPFEESWGRLLEVELNNMGIRAEVVNFGVPAYGFDQACLMWQKEGRKFKPDIVILGFFIYDALRCANIFRPIASPGTGFFFSKPRFVIRGDSLELANHPAMRPDEVAAIMRHFDRSELAKYEYFYNREDYERHFWQASKFLTLLLEATGRLRKAGEKGANEYFSPSGEPGRVAMKVIDKFEREVGATGAKFFVVHLPNVNALASVVKKEKMPYEELLKKIDASHTVIHPEEYMAKSLKNYNVFSLYVSYKGGDKGVRFEHYSFAGNKIVADVIAHRIKAMAHKKME